MVSDVISYKTFLFITNLKCIWETVCLSLHHINAMHHLNTIRSAFNDSLIELRIYVPLDTKQVILETF